MQPLVQSAIDAANHGDHPKALELCKQALAANPNDVDAWLVVAAVVDQPERKRQCLNRVLALDPTNQIARDELLDMDRAALGGTHTPPFISEPVADLPQPTYPSSAPLASSQSISTSAFESKPISQPVNSPASSSYYPTSTSAFEAAPAPEPSAPATSQPEGSSSTRLDRPLVFRYSGTGLIMLYLFTAVSLCGGFVYLATEEVNESIRCFVPAILSGLFALSVTSKVVVSEAGIRNSTLFSSAALKWKDIASLQSNSTKKKLKLISNKGKSLNLSTQVKDYSRLVEILRQKRPDLFGADLPSPTQGSASAAGYEQPPSTATPAFQGTKTFKKGFFGQYGLIFSGVFLCLALIFIVFSVEVHWDLFTIAGILLVAGFGGVLIIVPFFSVSALTLKPRQLTLSTFFGEKEISAHEIREIQIKSVAYKREQKNFVELTFEDGKTCGLDGFAEGPEIIYGFLMNWWNSYKDM